MYMLHACDVDLHTINVNPYTHSSDQGSGPSEAMGADDSATPLLQVVHYQYVLKGMNSFNMLSKLLLACISVLGRDDVSVDVPEAT